MPVSGITLANELLKKFYLPVFQVQFNEAADELLAQMERNSEMVQGSKIVMGLQYGKSGGIGALATDISTLPNANARKVKQAEWETKNLAARFMLSDKLMKASQTNAGAFAQALKLHVEDTMADAKDDLSRQVYGNGTGILAVTAAVTGVATVGVSNTKFLAEAMLVDVRASNGTVKNAGLEVLAVDEVANTITLSANVTTLSTDIITRAGVESGSEVTGLDAWMTRNNTVANVNRATNPWFNPTVVAVNGNIQETQIQKGLDEAKRLGGAIPNYASVSYGVARAIQNLLTAQRRNIEIMTLKGGYETMAYVHPKGRLPIVGTKYSADGAMRLLSLEHWMLAELGDWDWLEADHPGSILHRVSNTAAYEATLVKYCDLACRLPKAQVALTGITEA